jgi:type II secretory pathway pseudopilin PulG
MRRAPGLLRLKQRGALIVALMAGIAIMLILSTVAVQAWADVARRDAEAEMMFRAQDITRALKRFQADRGTLPTDLKELLEVGQRRPQYFLRQMWKDPLVKDGKWGLIYANPAGGVIDPSVPGSGTPGGLPGLPGQPNQPGQPGQPATGLNGNNNNMGSFPPIGKIGENNGTGTGAGEGTGLPIAGVKSKCTDRPFRKFRDKTSYSEWIFTIFDLEPRAAAQVSQPAPQQGQPGQPAQFPPTPVTPNTGNPGGK